MWKNRKNKKKFFFFKIDPKRTLGQNCYLPSYDETNQCDDTLLLTCQNVSLTTPNVGKCGCDSTGYYWLNSNCSKLIV